MHSGMELLDTYIIAGGIGWLANGATGMVLGLLFAAAIRFAVQMIFAIMSR